jgi:truncated hemoglobin YjbI
MVREASRFAAAGGEIGNSDAIRLLQIPHSKEDVEDVLLAFDTQLSREAKSKLMLDAFVPPPPDVVNQRYKPLFDKYVISGRTYTTASGAVIPNELQYYNGEMVHFYGECTNVSEVNEALAGSGYKAVTLKYADGRRTAVAQLWSNRFTDTSIGPYSAMFIVVVAVRDDAPPDQASIKADPNCASSVLMMLDGSFDPATAVYENRVRLFMVRLLDTTQVAIDVGRERMGTDKRPGTIDMARSGRRLRLSINAQGERGVVRADLELADDPAAYMSEVAKAAATAGIRLRSFPPGTEYVYPAVARIGRGAVVCWQWRSDVVPRLQPVVPGAVVFDPSSEEGRLLLAWGFMPKVSGYVPNVRGVITGLADRMPQQFRGGSIASRETAYGSAPPLVAASVASWLTNVAVSNVPLLRAALPGELGGVVGQLPVLRLVAQELSSRLQTPVETPSYGERSDAGAVSRQPHWAWDTTFLGSFTGILRKEVVGVTPDGFRIDWHLKEGSFVGPDIDLVVLPGAADWARIRKDGVGSVSVQACFETRTGERIYGSYGGVFDLGPDGYARALRDEFDPLPPVVVTPTFATAHPRFAWLNRVQCIGVGRVDMNALRIEFDVYVVRVGHRTPRASNDANTTARSAAPTPASLYTRIGGHDVIVAFTEDFVAWSLADRQLGRFFPNVHDQKGVKELNERIVEFLSEITGGPCLYKGRDMKTAHKGLGINEVDWKIAVDLFTAALVKHHVPPQAQSELLQMIENMKSEIVEISA